nr:TIGR03545 family protein [Gammaproteobacteria bacterium]
NVKEILAAEPLLSDKLINELEEDLARTDSQWQEMKGALPDKEKWQQYESRYKEIQLATKGDATQKLAAIKDAKQLKNDLKAEAQLVKQAKQQVSTDLDRINAEFKAAKAAPAADIARIKDKYNLGNLNAENISQMLFGDQISGYVTLAKQWYRRIEPYLPEKGEAKSPKIERSEGLDVAFREYLPRPDFYVGVANITANLPRGRFEGAATAISSDQSINKEPMRLKLSGVELTNKDSEEISAEFNYINKDSGFSRFKYAVVKSRIDDFVLSRSSRLPLTMEQALMDLKLDAKLQQGSLSGTVKTEFDQVMFNSADSSSMLASSFKGVNSFDLNGKFSGSMSDLSVNIDSNLDSQLGQQLKVSLNQKKLEFENDLRARLDAKLEQPMSKLEAKKASLESVKARIDEREKALQSRQVSLQQIIDEEKEQKKEEATDKLKDKVKDKLGL